jgi:hypothetical protein
MSANPVALVKNPPLEPAQDFYRLRREGIGFIEQMGSGRWTDYNVHDPGITILEALCYAITDLGYRIGWDIADILSPQIASSDPLQPYPNQAFFTARNILTVNPTTSADFRRLLIDLPGARDLPGVRDAWLICKACACEVSYFAWCDNDNLVLSYAAPANLTPAPREVWALGLYEALLELEADPELGDLNDRKVEYNTVFHDANGAHAVIMELRFPDTSLLDRDQWQLFLGSDADFVDETKFTLTLTRLGATKTFDVFTDLATTAEQDSYIRNQWRNIFYLSFEIGIVASGKKIVIENAALRVFGDTAAKNAAKAADWQALFQDKSAGGFVQRYRKKATQVLAAVKNAKAALQAHRNLDEDYCIVQVVGVEEVAVCADVEVEPDADIERVQAQIWFEIEQYFNPPIPFHTLQELRDAGEAVEDIFNGPALANGFIATGDLEAASLRTVLRASDIINRLMDIENPCDDVVGKLADLLLAEGLTADGTSPSEDDACACANALYHAFSAVFIAWYEDKTLAFLHADALEALIGAQFQAAPTPADVTCTTVLDAALWTKVQAMMTAHFVDIALYGWQFERFERAWCKWLDANAAIDWTEERLLERVQAILVANLVAPSVPESAICECARTILTDYGMKFHKWMDDNVTAGIAFEMFPAFVPPTVTLCPGMSFKAGTADVIAALLGERYDAYKEVSYWLWVVVNLLSQLRNAYPGATLHDCDDGSDHNPVRLDNTALGNYPLRTTLT